MTKLVRGSLSHRLSLLISHFSPECATAFERLYFNSPYSHYPNEVNGLNAFWKDQLLRVEGGARDIREWLCESDNHDDWLLSFEIKVLHTVIRNRLPVR